jgi:hypothetical protein
MNKFAIHPIIYVRGYAMTQSEIEDTVADPYMGFNIGSSKVRQLWDGSVKKYFFESPIVRLLKRFKYEDVFEEGYDRVSDLSAPTTVDGTVAPVPYRSIVIYRYYEPSSEDLGNGIRPDMERFARGLSTLILTLRKQTPPQIPCCSTCFSICRKVRPGIASRSCWIYAYGRRDTTSTASYS